MSVTDAMNHEYMRASRPRKTANGWIVSRTPASKATPLPNQRRATSIVNAMASNAPITVNMRNANSVVPKVRIQKCSRK